MSKLKVIAVMLVVLALLVIVPTAFAAENQTTVELVNNDSDVIDSDYYFDASVVNDNGNGTKDNPYKSLTTARIKDNSVIHLEDGQYNVYSSISNYNLTFIGKSSQNTIVNYAYFTTTKLTLINLTFKQSTFTNNGDLTAQNAIFKGSTITNKGNLTAQNAIFMDSSRTTGSGGVICSDVSTSQINIYNSTFENNHAKYGGAIYISSSGALNVYDTTFKNNYAELFGGAIAVENNANVVMKRSKFLNDYSVNDAGGAIYIRDSQKFIGENLEFSNCNATFGGAIVSLSSNVTLTNINAYNNKAKYNGGALYAMYGYINLKNSIFNANSADNGGAVFVDAVEIFNVYSNKFTNNIAQNTAGGVYRLLSEIYYDSIFDKALGNTFSNNKAKVSSDAFESDVINLTIGNGNYTLIYSNNAYFNGNLPSKYDLRDLNQVTSVKNQYGGGNCWAFSSLAALESCILKAIGTSYDLSEENMKNVMSLFSDYGWDMIPNDGGYDDMGIGYLAAWLGPVNENDDSYYDKSTISPLLNSIMHVQNILFLTRTDYTDNDAIKRAIMNYGAVSTCCYWDSKTYVKDKVNYYYDGSSGANHAVTIVGWDDTYSKSNFKTTPPGDGAWIIKNSWGTGSGDKGYYYVSYYDKKLATVNKTDVSFTFILNDTIRFDKNYQYDIPGRTDFFLNSSSTVWYKNIFESTSNEYLAAVSTYFQKETSWDLSIYVNNVLEHTQSGKSPSSYSTIELTKMIPLKIGDVFEVEFKISVKGDAGIPISEAVSLNHELYTEGISFISYDGINWVDFYDLPWAYSSHTYNSQVACIKAFTVLNPNDHSSGDEKLNQVFNVDSLEAYLNEDYRFSVEIVDSSGNALIDKKVSFTIDGKTFTTHTDREGIAILDYAFDKIGQYAINIFSPAEGKHLSLTEIKRLTVKSTVVLPSSNVFASNAKYSVILYDVDGNLLNNKQVSLSIGGNSYKLNCNNGLVSRNIDLSPGTYQVKVTNPVNNEVVTQQITVVKRITNNNDLTYYYGDSKEYKVRVCNDNGNFVSGLKVTFKLNGKTYDRYTDSNGYVSLTIPSLSPKTYAITAVYNGVEVSNNITVKSTIKLSDYSDFAFNSEYSVVLYNVDGTLVNNKQVSLSIGGNSYKLNCENGLVIKNIDLSPGTYQVKVTNPVSDEVVTQQISVVKRITENKDLTLYYGNSYKVRVCDDYGKFVSGLKVTFKLNGKTYDRYTDSNGYVSLTIPSLIPETYTITASYNGFEVSNSITVKSTVVLPSSSVFASNAKYSVTLYDVNGNLVNNRLVSLSIGGNSYKLTCNNGLVSQNIDLSPGTYQVKVTNPVSNEVVTQQISVVERITNNNDLKMYYGAGKYYKVKVVNDNGNVQKGLKVTFKVNGKTYYRYTDSNGYASLKISLKPKTYTVTATYKNYKVSNKITVKKTIITSDKTVKKGKTIKFTAKLLSTSGKILKNKILKFKFKGKTYIARTNYKGIATIKITKKYNVGKYTITTTYGKVKTSNKITIKK